MIEDAHTRDAFIKAHILSHKNDFDQEGWLVSWSLTCSVCKAINAESLKILATSNNYDIRQAATRILVDRFLSCPSEFASLSADLFSSDSYTRDLARRTVDMLERYADPSYRRRVEVLKKQAGLITAEPSLPGTTAFPVSRSPSNILRNLFPSAVPHPQLKKSGDTLHEAFFQQADIIFRASIATNWDLNPPTGWPSFIEVFYSLIGA